MQALPTLQSSPSYITARWQNILQSRPRRHGALNDSNEPNLLNNATQKSQKGLCHTVICNRYNLSVLDMAVDGNNQNGETIRSTQFRPAGFHPTAAHFLCFICNHIQQSECLTTRDFGTRNSRRPFCHVLGQNWKWQ